MQILNSYSKASGQQINLSKIGIIGGKWMAARTKAIIADILQMETWVHPGKYLGLPSEQGRPKTASLFWVKEKILQKIEGWKEGILNQAIF